MEYPKGTEPEASRDPRNLEHLYYWTPIWTRKPFLALSLGPHNSYNAEYMIDCETHFQHAEWVIWRVTVWIGWTTFIRHFHQEYGLGLFIWPLRRNLIVLKVTYPLQKLCGSKLSSASSNHFHCKTMTICVWRGITFNRTWLVVSKCSLLLTIICYEKVLGCCRKVTNLLRGGQ